MSSKAGSSELLSNHCASLFLASVQLDTSLELYCYVVGSYELCYEKTCFCILLYQQKK